MKGLRWVTRAGQILRERKNYEFDLYGTSKPLENAQMESKTRTEFEGVTQANLNRNFRERIMEYKFYKWFKCPTERFSRHSASPQNRWEILQTHRDRSLQYLDHPIFRLRSVSKALGRLDPVVMKRGCPWTFPDTDFSLMYSGWQLRDLTVVA